MQGDQRAEIAILGGGYVGLWTALRIKALEPSRDVAVLEQDICGGGASGRNGGFLLSWWSKLSSLVALCGAEDALRIARGSEAAIGEIRDFCAAHGIDAHFRQAGWIWTATTTAQMGSWDGVLAAAEKLGVEPFRRLSPEDVARRTGSPVHRAGVFEPSAATVQPAALARGLRRAALASGVRIYEHTRVRSFSRGTPVILRTDARAADRGEAGHRLERLGGRDPRARAGDRRDHERHGRDGAGARGPLEDRLDRRRVHHRLSDDG